MWGGVSALRYSSSSGVEAPQYLVAVRVASEAPDHIAGRLGLRDPELGLSTEVVRGLSRRLPGVKNAPFVEGRILGVAEGHPEEYPLRGGEILVHPRLYAVDSELQGLLVLGVREGRAPIDVAGELVEDDDEREPPPRCLGPVIQFSVPCLLEQGPEPLSDLSIDLGAAREPPPHPPPEPLPVSGPQVFFGEPVRKNLIGLARTFSHSLPLVHVAPSCAP